MNTIADNQGKVLQCAPDAKHVFNSSELLDRCLGKVDLAERILNRFLSEFTDDLKSLEALVDAGDHHEISRLAHRLKGAAANIAAPAIQSKLVDVESFGREHRLSDAAVALQALSHEYERFKSQRPIWRNEETDR